MNQVQRKTMKSLRAFGLVVLACGASPARAQEPWTVGALSLPSMARAYPGGTEGGDDEQTALAKKLENPVADLISIPFQFNVDFGIGSTDATRRTLNIQPVVPFALDSDWNLITRTIFPIIDQDSPAHGVAGSHGIGDITQSFFLSPKKPVDDWIVGAGPVVLWPTASDDALGTERYGVGPTAVALQQKDEWTFGILANHLWSLPNQGNNDRRGVNATFLQPFCSYTTGTHTTLSLNTESTYDWETDRWTVPVNFVVAQMLKIGSQPISVFGGVRSYLDAPAGGPNWGVRFGVTFIFVK